MKSLKMSKSRMGLALTWMALTDRLGCEQERCVVLHFIAVVDVVSIGVSIRRSLGHFFAELFFYSLFSVGRIKLLITFHCFCDAFRLCTTKLMGFFVDYALLILKLELFLMNVLF